MQQQPALDFRSFDTMVYYGISSTIKKMSIFSESKVEFIVRLAHAHCRLSF